MIEPHTKTGIWRWRYNSGAIQIVRTASIALITLYTLCFVAPRAEAQIAASADVTSVLATAHRKSWQANPRGLTVLSFSPDNAQLATAGDYGSIKVWKSDGALVYEIPSRNRRIFGLEWSPDARYLVTLEAPHRAEDSMINTPSRLDIISDHDYHDNSLVLWNAATGQLVQQWSAPEWALRAARWITPSLLVMSGLRNGRAFVQWRDMPSGRLQRELPIRAEAIAPNGVRFASHVTASNYHVKVEVTTLDGKQQRIVETPDLGKFQFDDLTFSRDSRFLLGATNDAWTASMWDANTLRLVRRFAFGGNPITRLLTSEKVVVAAGKHRSSDVFEIETGTYLGRFNGAPLADLTSDGRHIATAPVTDRYNAREPDWSGMVQLHTLRDDLEFPNRLLPWNTQHNEPIKLPLPGASMVGMREVNGQLLATAVRIGPFRARDIDQLLVWNVAQGAVIPSFDLKGEFFDNGYTGRGAYHYPHALSPSGDRIAVQVPADGPVGGCTHYQICPTQPEGKTQPVDLQNSNAILQRPTFSDDSAWLAAWRHRERLGPYAEAVDLVLWNARTGGERLLARPAIVRPDSVIASDPLSEPFLPPLAVTPNGQTVAAAGVEKSADGVVLYSADGSVPRRIKLLNRRNGEVRVRSLAWSPNGEALAIGATFSGHGRTGSALQHRVFLWDARQNRVARRLWSALPPRVLRWNEAGDVLVAGSGVLREKGGPEIVGEGGGEMRMWDVRRPFELSGTTRRAMATDAPVVAVALSGTFVLYAPLNSRPQLWNLAP